MDGEIVTVKAEGLPIKCRVIEIPGDGACLFSSLSYLLFGNISMAAQVRANIVSHVSNDWQRFKCFTMDRSGTPYDTKRLYLADMGRLYTYGTTCELKAAGEIFPFEFQLFQGSRLIARFGEPIQGIKRMRFNGHFNEGHFDVLIPVDSTNLSNVDAIASETTLSPCSAELPQSAPDSVDDDLNLSSNIIENKISESFTVAESQLYASMDISEELGINVSDKKGTKRRKRFTDNIRRKQIRTAAKKYAHDHPEVNREAVKKYAHNHPEINRKAVINYKKNQQTTVWKNKFMSGCNYDHKLDYCHDKMVNLGPRTPCTWCQAYKWQEEPNGMCCSGGKVQLPAIERYPEPLHSLLTRQHLMSDHFLSLSRQYNGCFQMTSFGAKEIKEGN